MLEISNKNLNLIELSKDSYNFKGMFETTEGLENLIDGFKNSSIFFEIKKNNSIEGIIGLEVIQTLNEFKLARLHFSINTEEIAVESVKMLLDYAIKEYYTVKIICQILENSNTKNILISSGLILNRNLTVNDINVCEYKITKPMYLRK